ncbi:hypothetical protein SBV1_1560034 [Verrucomicrobia bacterium]|nr:hypothetical protein SBV1_1560034 [Verrucomicrobiota bacterium]
MQDGVTFHQHYFSGAWVFDFGDTGAGTVGRFDAQSEEESGDGFRGLI